MITTLVFTDDLNMRVEYKTTLGSDTNGKFQILDIVGLNDTERSAGLDFKLLPSDIGSFKEFARVHALRLQKIDTSGTSTIVDYTTDSSS